MSNFTPEFQQAVRLLHQAGFSTVRWSTRYSHLPILISLARENDQGAASRNTKNITDPVARDAAKQAVMNQRVQSGEEERTKARSLGHQEVNGLFRWERPETKNQPLDCLVCGIDGHNIERCPHFLRKYHAKHNKPYTGAVLPPVNNPVQASAGPSQDVPANPARMLSPSEDRSEEQPHSALNGLFTELPPNVFAIAANFRGYATFDQVTNGVVHLEGVFDTGVMRNDTEFGGEFPVVALPVPMLSVVFAEMEELTREDEQL